MAPINIQSKNLTTFNFFMNEYLIKHHDSLLLTDNQVGAINTSVNAIKNKISEYYNVKYPNIKIFGSFNRKTIIKNDNADIDIMVVFDNDSNTNKPHKPQTLLSNLKVFGENKYPRSLCSQSFPVIKIELDHIKFDLVPAVNLYGIDSYLHIPSKDFTDWINTDVIAFDDNINTKYTDKPILRKIARILKKWNIDNGKTMQSFELEKWITECHYSNECRYIKDYLFYFIKNSYSFHNHNDKTRRLKESISKVESGAMQISNIF